MEIAIVLILLSVICGYFGRHRLIGFWGFFFLSLIVTPIITLLFLIFTIDKSVERMEEENSA